MGIDWAPALLVGTVIGAVIALIWFGIEWGIRVVFSKLRERWRRNR
jgi:hypothetical protein